MSSSHKNNSSKRRRNWKPSFQYDVDYNDHFETPLIAYQDVLPLLDGLQNGGQRKDHKLYDPYYCDGRTAVLLRQLDFDKIIHEKRDFYRDIKDGTIPDYDTLITNPPYSDRHKERCLEYCIQNLTEKKKPFLLLMPNYVAARSYYLRILGPHAYDVVYIIPSARYIYDHPEGTGHEVSPFDSLWFCGIGRENIPRLKKHWDNCNWSFKRNRPRLISSLSELEQLGAIPTQKRPNPRQRKKRKLLLKDQKESIESHQNSAKKSPKLASQTTTSNKTSPKAAVKKNQKKSRYRDERGQRVKKRF